MEIMDVYTAFGLKTEEVVLRGTKLDGDKYLMGVSVWIINSKGEYLMQKASEKKKDDNYPNTYEMTGGAVSAGDTIIGAAKREVKEELGLDILDANIEYRGRMDNAANIFLVRADYNIDEIVIQKEEVSDVKWMTVKEIEEMNNNNDMHPMVYKQFEEYINNKRNKVIKRSAAYILFYKEDKFLILRRSPDYNFEYSYIGGGIEANETKEQAIERELKEELVYEINSSQFDYLGHTKFYGYYKDQDYDLDTDVFVCELGNKLEEFSLTEPNCSLELLTIDEIKKVDISGHDLDTLRLVEKWNEDVNGKKSENSKKG